MTLTRLACENIMRMNVSLLVAARMAHLRIA